MAEHLLNNKEAADYLGITEQKLKELVRKKIIPAYRIGGAYLRFKKNQLNIARSMLHEPARGVLYQAREIEQNRSERIKDFLYFNDFYIISIVLIILAVVVIFTS